jgi:hypothetical protein
LQLACALLWVFGSTFVLGAAAQAQTSNQPPAPDLRGGALQAGVGSSNSTASEETDVATSPPGAPVPPDDSSGSFFSQSFTGELPPSLTGTYFSESDALSTGLNFNEFPKDFTEGITFRQGRWAVKLGGYVKADLLHDFRAIDSRDSFDPSTIPVGEVQRTNTRFHARQTRLSMDARWITNTGDPLRLMVEGDFFGPSDSMRLRHAFGEYEGLIIGQTWTTFTHRAALPNTLDVVGDVASVGRRQAQVRYTRSLLDDRIRLAAAIENPTVQVEDNLLAIGNPRTPLPDLISRVRYNGDYSQFQLATLVSQVGFQPFDKEVITRFGGGLNATCYVDITERCRTYGGILWGQGIGNYRDLPDLALTSPTAGKALNTIAWYSGLMHQWSKRWSSNLTYSQGDIENTPLQPLSSVSQLQYTAVNLIWQPNPYTFAGTEYLWGKRLNRDGEGQDASRIMVSFGFLLP